MLKSIPNECLQEIFILIDIDSLFSLSKSNKFTRDMCYLLLYRKYQTLINFFQNNQYQFKISDCDLQYLKSYQISSQINILLRLIIIFQEDISIGNEEIFWVNRLRFKIKNTHGVTIFNFLNKYIGMGHDYSLWCSEDGQHLWLDFQGGSNGYEYESNLKRIKEVDLKSISTITIETALRKMLEY